MTSKVNSLISTIDETQLMQHERYTTLAQLLRTRQPKHTHAGHHGPLESELDL